MVPRPLPTSVLFAALLVACAPAPGSTASPDPSPSAVASEPSDFPVTLADDAGRSVTLEAAPQRIVSLAPSNTEIVCALDACDSIVGVTDVDDYPPQIAEVERVVTSTQVDLEAVVAMEPDLVLAAGNELTPTAVIEQLSGLGLPVLALYPESLEGIYADIELVGRAIDRGDEASALIGAMEARVDAVRTTVADLERPRTFYEVGVFEGTIYTAGDGSFLASLIDTAGGEPITGDALSTSIAIEDLVAADPELILLGDASYDRTITVESVAARPGWETLTAVVEGRVLPVAEDVVITRPGPRIVDGLEALARAIHPDAFGG